MDYTGRIPSYIQLYVFDLDGTLVDSLADLSDSVNEILGRSGLPSIDSGTVRRFVGNGARNLLYRSFAFSAQKAGDLCPPHIADCGVLDDPDPGTVALRLDRYPGFNRLIDAVMPDYREIYWANCALKTDFYPGIREWLAKLSADGCTLAVLSNKPEKSSVRILSCLESDDLFDAILGPETTGVLKPDPEGIRILLARTGIPASRTVMIGDSPVDIETGRRAGVLVCGITGGFGDEGEIRKIGCDILIERREESLLPG